MARTEFLQIRLTPEDRKRLEAVAAADHLDTSTWARRVLLKEADNYEASNSRRSGEIRNELP
jgi:hypothetical protein